MKLVIIIAHERDKHKLADALSDNNLPFTKLGSTGGFLRQGNVTFLVGVEEAAVPRVMEVVKSSCGVSEQYVNVPGEVAPGLTALGAFPPNPVKVEAGGAVAFVVSVDEFQRF